MNIEDVKKNNPCGECRKREYCGTPCSKHKRFIRSVINDKEITEFVSTHENLMQVLNALTGK